MRRDDLDAFADWGRHDDPLFRHYDPRALDAVEADDLWRFLAGSPRSRLPYVGLAEGRVVASLLVRNIDRAAGTGEIGIVLDPHRVGRGLGRRILERFAEVLAAEGFRRLVLDVMGYNGRAIAAYRAAGFEVAAERWDDPEPGIDLGALLAGTAAERLLPHVRIEDGRYRARVVRMHRRLELTTKD